MAKSPEIGVTAPDFTLPSVALRDGTAQRADLTLSQQRGNPLVLVFYPGDETSVCTKQLCSYTSELQRFSDLGATVWAISPQDLDSHESFARKQRLGFPLLADTGRAIVRTYGIGLPGLGLRRSVFVIDADGILRWKHVALIGLTYPDATTIADHIPAHSMG